MSSTPVPDETSPNDALIARADERLAHAYEQIARADEQLARMTEQLTKMERDSAPHPPSAGPPPQPPPGRSSLRSLFGLLVAACIVLVALVLQSSLGGSKSMVARWAPQLVSAASLPPENPPDPAQPASSGVQVATAEAAAPQATAAAQIAPKDTVPPAAAALPDQTQLLQTIARDLANVERDLEQLKVTASDNSKAIEQFKANQQEMQRRLATVSEQGPPKMSSPPKQVTATPRKPERTLHSLNARARPRIPREWMYDEW